MSSPRVHALIPAAGMSVRFGGTTVKQYAHLLGKPVIAHSIEAVSSHPGISHITVALAEDDGIYDQIVRPHYPQVSTITGGPSRAHTVLNGLRYILKSHPKAEWVLVHDAARPCLSRMLIHRVFSAALLREDGAILAIPVSDTIKQADAEQRIEETVDREGLWRAQTPQMFPLRPLAEALAHCIESGEVVTDEAAAMERAGRRPHLVESSQLNIKITGPQDLKLAELILREFSGKRETGNHGHSVERQ